MSEENNVNASQEQIVTETQSQQTEETSTETQEQTNETQSQESVTTESQETESQETESQANDPEPFLGTYKTKEDAEKGLAEKDRYINELKEKLQALQQAQVETYKQMGYENPQQFQDAQIEQALQSEYLQGYNFVTNQYLPFYQGEYQPQSVDELIKGLPSELASRLTIELINLESAFNQKRNQVYQYRQTEAQKQQEAFKNNMYEQYKDHKEILDLFFDPNPTIEKAIALKKTIIDNYNASLKTAKENNEAKQKLQSAVTGSNSAVVGNDAIPTTWTAIVDKMDKDPQWFKRNESKILSMRQQGLIK